MKHKLITLILIGIIVLIPWGNALAGDVDVYHEVNEWESISGPIYCQGQRIQLEGEHHIQARFWYLLNDKTDVFFLQQHITGKGFAFSEQDQWEYKYNSNFSDHLYTLTTGGAEVLTHVFKIKLKGLNGAPDLTLNIRTHYNWIESTDTYILHSTFSCD